MSLIPSFEVSEWIEEMGGSPMHKCYQCGTCSALCPWGPLTGYSPRLLNIMSQLGLDGLEDLVWECSTCKLCVDHCPRDVDLIGIVQAVRKAFGEGGMLPAPLRTAVGSLQSSGNPWSGAREKRLDWASGADLPTFQDQDYAWFPCCTLAYDPRNKAVARSQLALLKSMGISFGAFGNEINCCAESLTKIGEEELVDSLQRNNRNIFESRGVEKLLVSSPHCLDTFKNDYDSPRVQPVHFVEILAEKLADGTLKPSRDLGSIKVTFHDPCYLGRHNGIYDQPRQVLEALPGVKLVEMPRNRAMSYCCGGGGGKMWAEVPTGQRPSENRIEEALNTGAQVMATACPYCLSMFEDAIKTLGAENDIRVVDISELAADACGL